MPSPESTPPPHAAFAALLKGFEQQLEQINAWIRSLPAPGVVPSCTEASKASFAVKGQIVLVTDGGSGNHFQGYTGSAWVALG